MSQKSSFIRTSNAIMYAFITLLKEKSFEKITVQDILEKTPVTRATFYAHYHDKYEIAEKMLEKYLENRTLIRLEIAKTNAPTQQVLQVSSEINHDLIEALLKIHTEDVDLRRAIVQEFEKEYLKEFHGQNAHIEARIFAQARAELEFAIYDDSINITTRHSREILQNVAKELLRIVDETEKYDNSGAKKSRTFKQNK